MQIQVPPYFLPNLDYFTQLRNYVDVSIDLGTRFQKQSFINRSYILGPHKIETLTVPIKHRTKHLPVGEVEISYAENWQRRNWLTIENCYRTSPFFEYYESYFLKIMHTTNYQRITDLNTDLLTLCLKLLSKNTTLCPTYNGDFDTLAMNYKKPGKFGNTYRPFPYTQNFGSDFVPNLSVIDLLFCKGPESGTIVNNSAPV